MDETVTTLPRTRWGILSTGHIAGVFARDLALLPDEAELAAVASRNTDKAAQFAAEHGFARSYGSYQQLADDPDVDVVYIASPHHDHLESAKMCLAAGKAVLVEKPLTVNAADTRTLIDFAEQHGQFLMEALWTRTNPLLRKAIQVVADGELGPVRHIDLSFGFRFDGEDDHRLLNPELAGGAILDLGVYPVHLVNAFLGEPADVLGTGSLARTGVDAHAAATLFYPATDERPAATAAVLATLEADPGCRFAVACERGRLEFTGAFANENVVKPHTLQITRGIGDDAQTEEVVTQLPGGGYTLQAQEVMHRLRAGETQTPLVPWQDTLAVARTLDRWLAAVQEAAATSPGAGTTSGGSDR